MTSIRNQILQTIEERGPLTRDELESITKIHRPSLNTMVWTLTKTRVLQEKLTKLYIVKNEPVSSVSLKTIPSSNEDLLVQLKAAEMALEALDNWRIQRIYERLLEIN